MPSEKPVIRLEDIIENIDRIRLYTKDSDLQSYLDDQMCQDAVERCILRISEAAKKLEGIVDSLAPDQRWAAIRAMGNVLRHEYDAIDPSLIWRIVTRDLAPLRSAVEAMLILFREDEPETS